MQNVKDLIKIPNKLLNQIVKLHILLLKVFNIIFRLLEVKDMHFKGF